MLSAAIPAPPHKEDMYKPHPKTQARRG
jgi:hypothetical protein